MCQWYPVTRTFPCGPWFKLLLGAPQALVITPYNPQRQINHGISDEVRSTEMTQRNAVKQVP